MAATTLRVKSVTAREREGVTRVVLVLDYLGTTPIDFEEEILEEEDLSIELPSTTPPV